MARAKKGTKEGELAAQKWRETMLKKFGGREGVRQAMQEMGRLGGMRSRLGGFGANPDLAKEAGRIGGRRSRRGPGNITETKIRPQAKKIEELYGQGLSIAQIAEKLELPYSSLLKWAKEELEAYQAGVPKYVEQPPELVEEL